MSRKSIAYFYPFEKDNQFVQHTQNALQSLGFRICRVSNLVSFRVFLNRHNNITVLNWVEDQKYGRSYSLFKGYFIFFKFLGLILLSKVMSKQVIWIKHNLKPHNASNYAICHRLTCAWFQLLNIKPIGLEEYYSANALKHPLYSEDTEIIQNIKSLTESNDVPAVLFFGAIKPYKNLHVALTYWPISLPLKIRGQTQSVLYEQQLRTIIKHRKLNIDWKNELVTVKALNAYLNNSDFVLLPHSDGSMISSGSYYHAISLGCNILCLDSKFARHKSTQFSFTHIFDPEKLGIDWLKKNKVPKEEVLKVVLKNYGEKNIINSWKKILSIT